MRRILLAAVLALVAERAEAATCAGWQRLVTPANKAQSQTSLRGQFDRFLSRIRAA